MLRLKRAVPTKVERLVAFSDGVFAVAITLLALDLARIKADPSAGVTIFDSLAQQWPTLLAFAGAFAFIGVAWLNHYRVFTHVKAVSRALNGANLLLLAGVALIPWVTGALAEGLGAPEGDRGTQEIVLYGAVTGIGALTWALLYHVLARDPDLLVDSEHARHFAADRTASSIGIVGTLAAAGLGYFWSPIAATILFLALPVFYAIGSEGFERTARRGDKVPRADLAGLAPLILAADEGTEYDWSKDHVVVKTPLELTEGRVTLVEDTLKPGFHLPRHRHRGMVEIFHILEGEAVFTFEDGTTHAIVGMTISIPKDVWHEVSSPNGARLLTIFTPGGFDHYLAELSALSEADIQNESVVKSLSESYDL